MRTLTSLLFVMILIAIMLWVWGCQTADALVLDHILDGVKDIIGKEIQKIEDKIDEFIMAEVQKIKHQLMVLYIVMIIINMIYSTILVFAVRKYLNKEK